jgi:catechol 2,3-dioxygenase
MQDPLPAFPNLNLSHFEIYVSDVESMERFYNRCLGFFVTDRSDGENTMIFLSRNPAEHHQLVLSSGRTENSMKSPLDHIAFRIESLSNLRVFHNALISESIPLQTVSHGNTWSIYFRDPEDNRLELFTDTPWHVNQPCRFEIDFNQSDEELVDSTKNRIKDLPGFEAVADWRETHANSFMPNQESN